MGYYTIGDKRVFVSHRLDRALRDEALANWSALDRVGSGVVGQKSVEADALLFTLIQQKAKEEGFYESFVKFDFGKEEAQLNAWDLIYDFCHLRGCGRLVDTREFVEKLEADYAGESFAHPMGKVFELQFPVRPRREGILARLFSQGALEIRFRIEVARIERIHGDMDKFEVLYGDRHIEFSDEGIGVRL